MGDRNTPDGRIVGEIKNIFKSESNACQGSFSLLLYSVVVCWNGKKIPGRFSSVLFYFVSLGLNLNS